MTSPNLPARITNLRRYTFKLYPTAAQDAALHEQRQMHAHLWNALLQMREERWRRQSQVTKEERRGLTYYDQCKDLTALRQAMPEWAALSSDSMSRTAQLLDEAFKAFFRRLKKGEGEAGYPRFKRTADHGTIPFKKMGSGWKLTHIGACNWRLYAKGVPGLLKTRGKFPLRPQDYRNAEIIWRDDAWWLSVCVSLPPRCRAGAERIKITFDLIDEFARVERADGPSRAASKEGITGQPQHVIRTPGAVTPDSSGDERLIVRAVDTTSGAVTPDSSGDERGTPTDIDRLRGAVTPDSSGDERTREIAKVLKRGAVTPDSSGDERKKPQDQDGQEGAVTPDSSGDERQNLRLACGPSGAVTPDSSGERAAALCAKADAIKAARDTRFPRKPFTKPSCRWLRQTRRARKLTAKAARIRKHALHLWSCRMVNRACDLTVVIPKIKEMTTTPRGDRRQWGACVETVSGLNRHVLNFAPAFAAQALAYKAEEAGIRCDVSEDEAPKIGVGRDLVTTGKTIRRAKRAIRKETT